MKLQSVALCFYISTTAFAALPAGQHYTATIDLKHVQNDRVKVTVEVPPVNTENIVYCIPKIVPGTYSIYDFGRFVTGLQAFDANGNTLPVEIVDVNQYKISRATLLHRIEYWVDDSYDMTMDNPVFEPAGTNISNDNFVVNTFGFVGYLEGMKKMQYDLVIEKPETFYGATALIASASSPDKDIFQLNDYDHMADSPLLYGVADTASVEVGGAQVLIGIYSPNHVITAQQVMDQVRVTLKAQEAYLGGKLPVKKYAFLIYFTDTAGVSGSQGALEHKQSSMYYLSERPVDEISDMLKNVCAHEFFHIVTPLTIHATQISDFDFIHPDMSEHLWLYEGQTEYAAHHAQEEAGIITTEEFLNRMKDKIDISQQNFNDTLPFTVMSKNCLDTYKGEYNNVYQKGALINMCLDIELRKLSNGKYGTQELMRDLGKMYGINKPFYDDSLFDAITQLTYPEIRTFFSNYVEGSKPIPYETFMGYAGIILSPIEYTKTITMGNISLNYNIGRDSSFISIQSLDGSNAFAKDMKYKVGDRILSVNGISLTAGYANDSITAWKAQTKPGDKVIIYVDRTDKSGVTKTVKLKGKAMAIDVQKPRTLLIDPNASAEQTALLKAWLRNNP